MEMDSEDARENPSQSTGADNSQNHDPNSQFEMHSDDSSDDGQEEIADDADEVDNGWNIVFSDDAMEFVPQTHSINSELQVDKDTTPLQIFQKFLTEDLVKTICEESHRYAQQKGFKKWTPFSTTEFWRFVAVNLTMGLVKKPTIKDYWSKNPLTYTPFFSATMTRDRYVAILRSLHFVDNSNVPATNTDRFVKMGSFMETLLENFRKAVHPGEYLCLDESLVPFKGRLSIRQYNPKKRSRFGVKLFVLADCATKMILDIMPYQGKSTKISNRNLISTLAFGGAAVATMMEGYMDNGHRVIIDNWFNSPKLARLMKQRKTYVLGTVQKKRQGMPKGGRMKRKLKKGEVQIFSDGDILVERWMDRREVFMLNTFLDHTMVPNDSDNPRNQREKPGSVMLYNSKMGAVDDADKVVKPYNCLRKTYKWYRKVAFHFIDLAVYNSLLVFCQLRNKKTPYKSFLEDLIAEILEKNPKPTNQSLRGRPATIRDNERLAGGHFPEQSLRANGKAAKSDCAYCRLVKGDRSVSSFRCSNCKKWLCIRGSPSCFQLYHTSRKLKKSGQTLTPEVLSDGDETCFENSQISA